MSPKPPTGYATWLDYAVATMDTRRPHLDGIADGAEVSRSDIAAAAGRELAALRERHRVRDTAKEPPTGADCGRHKCVLAEHGPFGWGEVPWNRVADDPTTYPRWTHLPEPKE